jgi:hypothetical protein
LNSQRQIWWWMWSGFTKERCRQARIVLFKVSCMPFKPTLCLLNVTTGVLDQLGKTVVSMSCMQSISLSHWHLIDLYSLKAIAIHTFAIVWCNVGHFRWQLIAACIIIGLIWLLVCHHQNSHPHQTWQFMWDTDTHKHKLVWTGHRSNWHILSTGAGLANNTPLSVFLDNTFGSGWRRWSPFQAIYHYSSGCGDTMT